MNWAIVNHICLKKCVNSAICTYPALLGPIYGIVKKTSWNYGWNSCRDNQVTYTRFFLYKGPFLTSCVQCPWLPMFLMVSNSKYGYFSTFRPKIGENRFSTLSPLQGANFRTLSF